MTKHLFLYLDILGFTELLSDPEDVEDLYGVIDSLNVFKHNAFECIVFSDTLLIYDPTPADTGNIEQIQTSIMWLCEFAQYLMYRLISTDRHYRALLSMGEFKAANLKNFQYFYGEALVETHNYEKRIQSTGLYMHSSLTAYSNIFKVTPYDSTYSYVFLTQDLNTISDTFVTDSPSSHAYVVKSQGLEGMYVYNFVYLKNIYTHMNNTALSGAVRTKYINTWHMLSVRYQEIMAILVANKFDPTCIIDLDWAPWLQRVKDRDAFHG